MRDLYRPLSGDSVRAIRALTLAGAFGSWRFPTLAAVVGIATWEAIALGRIETAIHFTSFLVPFFAGTGALCLARLGRFDMIVGAGVTRRRLAVMAVGGALLPVAVVAGVSLRWAGVSVGQAAAFAGMALFMAGVGVLGGLAGPTMLVGVLWFIARGMVLTTSWGQETLRLLAATRLDSSFEHLSESRLTVALICIPEIPLGIPVPSHLPALFAVVGTACLVVAVAWFERADWPGKRME